MSSSYGALLARPGARTLALACGLGWLSFTGYGLAIVLAVQGATGSFAVAGATVGAFAAGSALLAPVRGRLVDRRGPRVLARLVPVHAGALALLVACCAWRPAPALLLGSAALAGAFTPPLIATARAVWPEVSGPGLAGTGHALNAALGDAAQVVGPAVTGAVAALASPLLALGLLIPGAATGALILSRTGVGSAAPRRPMAHRVWGALRESAGLRTVVVCELALGVWLGAFEDGAPELAALPLAVFGAGSVIASLWSGTGRLRRPAGWRCVGGAIGLAAVFLAPLATPSLSAFAAIAAVGGGCFGVITVALFELIDEVVASTRAIEALTWITSAQGAGVAGGAAAAGRVSIEGAWNALLVVAISAVACALIAAGRRATLAVAVPR